MKITEFLETPTPINFLKIKGTDKIISISTLSAKELRQIMKLYTKRLIAKHKLK